MDALRLAGHASVVPAAEHAGGPTTRAAAVAAALVMRDINAFDSVEMNAVAADYATNTFSYPKLGVKYQTTDNTIRKYEDFRQSC
jgi:hypothetical protein